MDKEKRIQIISKIFPLGYKNDFKILLKTAIPLILGNLSQIFIATSSVLFCGHLGSDELDAASLANSLIDMCALVCAYGLSSACDTILPQLYGANNKKKLGLVLQKAIVIGFISTIVSIILLLNARHILFLFEDNQNIVYLADQYILVFMPSIFFYNMAIVLSKYLQAQNIVNAITVLNFIAILINCLLHAIFIYVFKWEIRGAALAVDFASFSLFFLTVVYIYKTSLYKDTWEGFTIQCLYEWKLYLKLAIPALITLLIEWSNFEIGTFVAASIDELQLGLMSIAQQYLFIFFQFSYGIGVAANIIVGQYLGANQPEKASNAARVSYTLVVFSFTIIAIFLLSLSNFLGRVFTDDPDILLQSSQLIKVLAAVQIFDGIQGALSGILRAIGAQFYASIVMFIGLYVIGTPIGVTLLIKTNLKAYGFFIGIIFGLTVLIILQIVYIIRIDWQKKAQEAHNFAISDSDLDKVSDELSIENPTYDGGKRDNFNEILLTDVRKPIYVIEKVSIRKALRKYIPNRALFNVYVKRGILFGFLLALLIISIALHGLTKLDISNNDFNQTNNFLSSSTFKNDYNFFKLKKVKNDRFN